MSLNKSKIEWCDATWSPISGCMHGCHYCYAKKRAENPFYRKAFPNGFNPTFYPERLQDPVKEKRPRTIFICSMGDAFGEWVPTGWLLDMFAAIEAAPQHTYCLLTKNPQRMKAFARNQENIWWGTSVTGIMDNERIGHLQDIESDNLFISFEPLLADPGCFNLNGIKGIIIGAQTKPLILPTENAMEHVERAARESGAKIFHKNSIMDNINGIRFSRKLPWKLYTKEAI
jgi:protein gp37